MAGTAEGKIVDGILNRNERLFRRHLVLSRSVLRQLRDRHILTDRACREIVLEDEAQQVPALLRKLQGRSLDTLRSFLEVLRETGHAWLVDRVMDAKAIDYSTVYQKRWHHTKSDHPIMDACVYHPKQRAAKVQGWATDRGKYDLLSVGELIHPPSLSPEIYIRGKIKPQDIFNIPTHKKSHEDLLAFYGGPGGYDTWQQPLAYDQPKEVSVDSIVPSSLKLLTNYFRHQQLTNSQILSNLQQEQVVIRQLMEQNSREQMKVLQSQDAVDEIGIYMKEIGRRAPDVYDSTNPADISRYRLSQLNQISWVSRR